MAKTLHSVLPDANAALALELEELALALLEVLRDPGNGQLLNDHNIGLVEVVQDYPYAFRQKLSAVVRQAWNWLERENLIIRKPGINTGGWYEVTEKGMHLNSRQTLEAYRNASLLPKSLLHPSIAQKVWATFIRGDYDTAVFQAFKEVEVSVRSAGGFSAQDLGTDLMRKAFNVTNGPLTDPKAQKGEQQALSDLYAGAIGLFKNPHSHRNVQIDATEAVEMIMLASLLLNIIDARTSS